MIPLTKNGWYLCEYDDGSGQCFIESLNPKYIDREWDCSHVMACVRVWNIAMEHGYVRRAVPFRPNTYYLTEKGRIWMNLMGEE
jgi:hypothetical protein